MTTQPSPPSPHYPAFHLSSISSSFSPYWLSPSIFCLAELLSRLQPFHPCFFLLLKQKAGSQFFSVTPLTKRGCLRWEVEEADGSTEVAAAQVRAVIMALLQKTRTSSLKNRHVSVRQRQQHRFEWQLLTMLVLWLLISTPTSAGIRAHFSVHRKSNSLALTVGHPCTGRALLWSAIFMLSFHVFD